MSPSTLLILGIISAVIGIIGLFINVATAADSSFTRGRSITSIIIVHGLCALFYIGGAISVVTAIVMFLINYAKN